MLTTPTTLANIAPTQLPVLAVLLPLAGAVLSAFAFQRPKLSACFAAIFQGAALLCAVGTLAFVLNNGPMHYGLGGWQAPFGIGYYVGPLGALMLCLVTAIGFAAQISAGGPYLEGAGRSAFAILSQLFCVGVAGMALTADAFHLYVLLEVASLTSYGLIALGDKRAALAAFRYLVLGSLGASLYLIGVGYLYVKTGTLNIPELYEILHAGGGELLNAPSIQIALGMLLLGLGVKAALFPLHGWLPGAYTFAPSASANLLAPLATKIMVYCVVRVALSIFGFATVVASFQAVVPWVAIAAILYGSIMALREKRYVKRALAYIIVAEVGYMFGGLTLGSPLALRGALFHILADGLMTFTVLLAVGRLCDANTGKAPGTASTLNIFTGAWQRMPLTMAAFCAGAMALIGLPPTCGFISKYYLIMGAFEVGFWPFAVALILASLSAAVVFFRMLEVSLFSENPPEGGDAHAHKTAASAPALENPTITAGAAFALVVAALSLFALGLYNQPVFGWIERALVF